MYSIFFHLVLKEIPFLLLRYNCSINYNTFNLTHLYFQSHTSVLSVSPIYNLSFFSLVSLLLILHFLHTMEIINSNKNKPKLCFEGYMYVLKHTGKSSITWRCSKATMLKCPGIMYYTDIEMSKIVKSGTTHIITHRPNKKEVEVSVIMK